MYLLSFKYASKHVKSVDANLEHILRGIWNQAPKEKQKDLCFYLAQYPYRSYLVKNGRPLDPAGHALSHDLIVAGGMPCGLILTDEIDKTSSSVMAFSLASSTADEQLGCRLELGHAFTAPARLRIFATASPVVSWGLWASSF
jgi:hypothetical protein